MSRAWDGRLSKLESYGQGKNGPCYQAKYVAHPVTREDLDRLFDQLNGEVVAEPDSDFPRDPETEAGSTL
jgi:hypothetical protein